MAAAWPPRAWLGLTAPRAGRLEVANALLPSARALPPPSLLLLARSTKVEPPPAIVPPSSSADAESARHHLLPHSSLPEASHCLAPSSPPTCSVKSTLGEVPWPISDTVAMAGPRRCCDSSWPEHHRATPSSITLVLSSLARVVALALMLTVKSVWPSRNMAAHRRAMVAAGDLPWSRSSTSAQPIAVA